MFIKGLIIFIITSHAYATLVDNKPNDIVDVRTQIPNVKHDIRYFSKRNFIGEEIMGYLASKSYLQHNAAKSLARVQADLKERNLELIIYDCYRPQLAVNHFVKWAKENNDIKMKHIFYPEVPKNELFKRGYIASKSGHSKGNTIDLGLITKGSVMTSISKLPLNDCRKKLTNKDRKAGLIEMGTHYDCFDELSHTKNPKISEEAKYNRNVLVSTMKKHGFRNYSKEWWHFSFKENLYPNTYHNFFVE